jgi:hypothetical protein
MKVSRELELHSFMADTCTVDAAQGKAGGEQHNEA